MTKLEGGDSKSAMARLRVPPMTDKNDNTMTPVLVTCGVLLGSTLMAWVLIAGIIIYGDLQEKAYEL